MCVYSECSNVVLLLPVAAIFTPIDFARPGGRKKKVGSFFTHTCVETDMLGFRTFSPVDDRGGAKTRRKCGSLRDLSPFSHFAEEGVRFFLLVWPIFSLYLFICETVCWAHFSVPPRCERNPFFPCGFFLLRERRRRGFLSSLSSSRG